MNKASYSNNRISKLATIPEAMEYYKLGRSTLMRVARNAGAIIRIGRCVRVDIPKMNEAIELYTE